ncbi:TPA: 50S ribosomal protein L19 [candidate division WOR-3 bacterium]|jgi:large subunit ribosomal protein L19|uniref:Large ribosomal subunit protein bL19 n=1 Tax=candidate division WOR-3 bacterium TaxID=2052148 RepID=A0A350HAW2_UNCW3|nr:50S ribosomal protein L19 [candidate division WOR-3 bacterium]
MAKLNIDKIQKDFELDTKKHDDHAFNVGDTVDVSVKIEEGGKSRIQKYRGIVISKKGAGTKKTFTVRKISQGIGVERIFPLFSPSISDVKVIKKGIVRRAKLNYMRKRTGKAAVKVD